MGLYTLRQFHLGSEIRGLTEPAERYGLCNYSLTLEKYNYM